MTLSPAIPIPTAHHQGRADGDDPHRHCLQPKDDTAIHLLLRKSQRDDGLLWWPSITFIVDARLDLDDEEQDTFNRYGLGAFVVYDSDARTAYAEAAYQHFHDAGQLPLTAGLNQLASSLMSNMLAVGNAILMGLSLRITFADLVAGQRIECSDLEAIMVAEDTIKQQCELLRAYLDTALTFDEREELYDY